MSQFFASSGQSIGGSASACLSNEYSELISFRMDWFYLLAVQGNLKSLLQHHSSKASILRHSAYMVHLSHAYMITGKTIALTRQTFVGKVMSLVFNYCLGWSLGFPHRSVSKAELDVFLAPWKKSYDKPRQHIKNHRQYFANKGPSSQSYGFSSSHVGM